MTQVLSTSSFYSHNWTSAEFNKRRSNWFEKIRQTENINRKRASVFPSLVYSRQTTHLKQHSDETNHCMHATKSPTNKNSKEELNHKSSTLLNFHSPTRFEESPPNVITPPKQSESKETANNLKRSNLPNHVLRKTNEKVSTNNLLKSQPSHPKLENEKKHVSVPSWSVNIYTGRYVIEGTEDLSDHVFLDRHERLEMAEKKRKRRDEKCLEEREKLNRLKQQNTTVNNHDCSVRHIEMVEKEPKCAFGRVIPEIKPQCFCLPPYFFTINRHDTSNLNLPRRTGIFKKSKKK